MRDGLGRYGANWHQGARHLSRDDLTMSDMDANLHATNLQAAAYHEAGHAVVAVAVGLEVYECWIDGEGRGEVRFRGWGSEQEQLAVAVAGACAESILLDSAERGSVESFLEDVELVREQPDEEWLRDLVGDGFDVWVLLHARTKNEAAEALREARDFARKALADEWADVQAIAASLYTAAEPR